MLRSNDNDSVAEFSCWACAVPIDHGSGESGPCSHLFCKICFDLSSVDSGGGRMFRCPACCCTEPRWVRDGALSKVRRASSTSFASHPSKGSCVPRNFSVVSTDPTVLEDGITLEYLCAPGYDDKLVPFNCVPWQLSLDAFRACCGPGCHLVPQYWCRSCRDYVCENCRQHHLRNDSTSSHKLVEMKEYAAVQPPFTEHPKLDSMSSKGLPCNSHGKRMTKECPVCGIIMCEDCTVCDHWKECVPSRNGPDDTSNDERSEDRSARLLSEAGFLLEQLQKLAQSIQTNREMVSCDVEVVRNEISDFFGVFHNILQARERELLWTLAGIHRAKNAELDAGESSVKRDIERLELLLRSKREAVMLTDRNFNRYNMTDDDVINQALEIVRENSIASSWYSHPVLFRPTSLEVQKALRQLGDLNCGSNPLLCTACGEGLRDVIVGAAAVFVVTARDYLMRLCRTGGETLTVDIRWPSGNVGQNTQVFDQNNGTYVIKYVPLEEGELRVGVKLKGIHISGSPFPVFARHMRHYELITCAKVQFGSEGSGDGDLCRPWGVCCDHEGNILVADRSNSRVQVFDRDGKFLWKFGSKGSNDGEFEKPAGICVDRTGSIIVADKDNHRVQKFDARGSFILKFGERGSHVGQFTYPWDVATNRNDDILVSDTRNHRVQLFNSSGIFLSKYSAEGIFWKQFDSPRGVAFNAEGDIIVTDFNNHRIVVLRQGGAEVGNIGAEGEGRGLFRRPQGVAVDREGNIIVADSKNHRVQVLSRAGKFIAAFGSNGNGPCHFERPSGVCVAPDGRIVVVDFGNNRILVF